MAAQNSLCVIASYTRKNNAQLFRSNHNILSMRDHIYIRSITSSNNINKCSQLLKSNKRSYVQSRSSTRECVAGDIELKHAILLKHVRNQLIAKAIDHLKLDDIFMVDAIYRVGLGYLFKDEIKLILERRYLQFIRKDFIEHLNLYEVSLCFRILRQNGFHVSKDVFKPFKGKDDKFDEKHKKDIRGMMELYEASLLRIKGENILDEAENFSSQILEDTITYLDDNDESRMIRYTLENPQRKTLTSCIKESNNIVQELAEVECKMVQPIRTMELNQISRWWNETGLGQDLCRARNQPLKWYIWPMVALPNPAFSQQRVDLTKVVSLIYVIDDVFDIYGTLDEVTLFTKAVNRWDIKAIEELPYYMRSSFKVLYEVTNEIAGKVSKKHGFNPMDSLRSSWATLCEAFLVEAKWFASGHVPTTDEYLKNGIVSSGIQVFLVHLFFLLGDGSTKEKARVINDNQGIVFLVSKILRLSDDLQCVLQDENQDGHDGSFVKCLLVEHGDISVEIATERVIQMISDAWKCLNKECLSGNPFSEDFTKGSINVARLVPLVYSYSDNNSFPLLHDIS
uniref:probable terpene synthase 13 n=1 Tax=Erigeron canadensis TaxID=72917 RepID=UPI001CB9C675|nr:probable terpene synthase 13 [Erigeron canadensis]